MRAIDGRRRTTRTAWLVAIVLLAGTPATSHASQLPGAGSTLRTAAALPTTERSSPALTSRDPGRLDVLTRSGDDVLHEYLPPGGSWRRPLNRGGTAASQPAAVSWGPGRLDIFARGTDNRLWHRSFAAGSWSAWATLGGGLTSAPAAASWGPGRLDVVVRRTADVAYQKTFSAGGWSAWTRIGGKLTSSPALTADGSGRLHLVVRSTGNAAYLKSYVRGSGWSGWTGLGGSLTSQPAVTAPGGGRLDVAGRGSTGLMQLRSFAPGTGWSAWTALGPSTYTSGPGITSTADGVQLAARRADGYLYRNIRSTPDAGWSGWRRIDRYLPFRRLATWVDTLDYAELDPGASVTDMATRGVRTLFLSTGRFNSSQDFFDEAKMAAWLDAAHSAGIRVVGWYVPGYGDLARDVRRTVAIGSYVSPGGQRFDAVGVDIERFGPAPGGEVDHATFNARVVPHLEQVRAGTAAVIAAIVPSPYATDPGSRWTGFPWAGIGPNSEVVVPMALWSFRSGFTAAQVKDWVTDQVDRTQALTGRRVHVEGGVIGEGTTPVTPDRVQAFVDATIGAGAIGGGQYDYNTMNSPGEPVSLWQVLAGLNAL